MAAARRARQASRADAPRVAKRVARARDEQPRSRKIQVCNRCHGRAVRTRREELSMACYRHARTRRRNGVAGHMAQGRRLRAIAWVRATYRRCRRTPLLHTRSARCAAHLPCMARGRTARLARCVGLRRSSARPTHTFSARRSSTNFLHLQIIHNF